MRLKFKTFKAKILPQPYFRKEPFPDFPFVKMAVGSYFDVPDAGPRHRVRSYASMMQKVNDSKFTVRKEKSCNGLRVYRLR